MTDADLEGIVYSRAINAPSLSLYSSLRTEAECGSLPDSPLASSSLAQNSQWPRREFGSGGGECR